MKNLFILSILLPVIGILKGTYTKKTTIKQQKTAVLIYCHGNSITAGASTYVSYLKAAAEGALPVTATVVNAATGGQNLIYFYDNLESQVLSHNPDIVTLQVQMNDLYNPAVGAKAIQYIDAVLAHTNPNGKHPRLLLMTDNAASEPLAPAYTAILQDSTNARLMAAYNLYSSNPKVLISNNYAAHLALTRESPAFLALLGGDGVHPVAAGQLFLFNTMKTKYLKTVERFLDNLN